MAAPDAIARLVEVPRVLEEAEFLPRGQLGQWLAERRGIWQMSFLSPRDLERFAKDRGLSFWHSHIERLWSLRLLQADLIISQKRLRSRGLIFLRKNRDGHYLYADERVPVRRTKGWANALEGATEMQAGVELLFHPFRYYVLYQLEKLFKLHIVPIQMLRSKSYVSMLELDIERFNRVTSKPEFTKGIARLNSVAALIVATEPVAYMRIYQSLKMSVGIEPDEQEARIAKHWEELTKVYEYIGLDQLEDIRKEVCIARDLLDDNDTLHTLLRLANAQTRERIRGPVGGAMLLLAMAETLRLGEERTFGVQLPEEDEVGFGWWPPDAKKNLYGSNRLLDGDGAVAGQFMRHLDLDYGIRVRWYVEGDSEYYAIKEAIEDLGATHVQLINLRGQFVEKGGKGLQFRESLRNDIAARIFSMITLDGDRTDYLKAVQTAAERDEMCGMFFVSTPDFELHNFSILDLEEVLWSLLTPDGQTPIAREALHDAIKSAKSSKEVFRRAQAALLDLKAVNKGQSWGRALFEYAAEHPDIRPGEQRPVLEAIDIAVRTRIDDYLTSRNELRTDPKTGLMMERILSTG